MNLKKQLFLCILCVTLISCSEKSEMPDFPDKSPSQIMKPMAAFKVTDPTVLRNNLPLDSIAYIRIPNMLGFMSAVKGDAFSEAMHDESHAKLVKQLRKSLEDNVFNKKEISNNPLLLLLLKYMQSPLEVAILPSSNQLPVPNALIAAKLNLSSIDELNKILEDTAGKSINVHLRSPVSEKAPGVMMSGPVPMMIEYNELTQVLRMMVGLTVDEQVFKATLVDLKQSANHPMYESENKIDDSHHGMFTWVNMQQALPIMKNTMPPEKLQELDKLGITKIESLSLGWGVSNEKGRLKAQLKMPRTGFREFIYPVKNEIKIKSSDRPRAVVSLSLPTPAQFKEIEAVLTRTMNASSHEKYIQAKKTFNKKTGVNYEDILNAFGPELIIIADKTGEYFALRIRDREKYKPLLEKLFIAGDMKTKSRKHKRVEIHHISFPSILSYQGKEKNADKPKNPIIELLQKGRSHIYWIEEGDYLVAANLPQMLIDRNNYADKVSVGEWLEHNQKQDISSSILMMSTSINDAHRKLYYAYVQILMYLGDLAETELDLYTLPTAMELEFPEAGTYGLQIDSSESSLGIEFTFENNPMEILIGQDMTSVAVIGILAAIAIPAYNDYTIRAQLASAIALTIQERRAVQEYFLNNGKFPSAEAINQLGLNQMPDKIISDLRILPDTGVIEFTIAGKTSVNGKVMVLTPQLVGADKGIIYWKCSGTIAPKYYPRSCR